MEYENQTSGIRLNNKWWTIQELLSNAKFLSGREIVAIRVNNGYQYFLTDGIYLGMEETLINNIRVL